MVHEAQLALLLPLLPWYGELRAGLEADDVVALLQVLPLVEGRHRARVPGHLKAQALGPGRVAEGGVDEGYPGGAVGSGLDLVLVDLLAEAGAGGGLLEGADLGGLR